MPELGEQQQGGLLPRPRKLSSFLAKEMVYDYVTGRLDPLRKKAMEEYLRENPELQQEVRLLSIADTYISKLAETRISAGHIHQLSEHKTTAENFFSRLKFSNWPQITRWVIESLLVSFAVGILALFVPWEQLIDNIMVSLPQRQVSPPKVEAVVQPEQVNLAENENSNANNQVDQSPNLAANQNQADVQKNNKETPIDTKAVASSDRLAQRAAEKPAEKPKAPALKGFVYSMMMSLPETPKVAQEIKKLVQELGGVKAGQVELGWRKQNPAGSYFHFSMPEENYDQLIQTLDGYGRVRIYKNPHERVMPVGKIRIILWIEDSVVEKQDNEEPSN